MKDKSAWKLNNIFLALLLSLIVWVFLASGTVSAASITASAPSSTTEVSSGDSIKLDGKTVISGNKVDLTLSASATVSDQNDSSVRVTMTTSGDCGFGGGKGATELGRVGAKSVKLHTSDAPNTSLIYLYPVYNPNYTGTRNCTVTFTHDAASSSNAEIVSLYGSTTIPSYTLKILDAQPKPSSTTPTPTPTPAQTPTTTQTTTKKIDKPDTPAIKLVDSNGEELKPEVGDEKITFKDKEPIILSGSTVPKGKVKLYIFSEPQEATVTADDQGAWTYTIASIEPGDHRVEVEVTDPETGETSERAEVLAFQVAQAETPEETNTTNEVTQQEVAPEENGNILPIVIGASLVLLLAGAGSWWWMKKRNN